MLNMKFNLQAILVIMKYLIAPVLIVSIIVFFALWSFNHYFYTSMYVLSTIIVIISINAFRIHMNENIRGWRVGHVSRDSMYYEENFCGKWVRIIIDGEMQLCGNPHHIIYSNPDEFPKWALPKMKEISNRIRSAFKKPEYEYGNEVKWEAAQQGDAPEPDSRRSCLSDATSRPGDL